MTPLAIETQNLVKDYGDVRALDGLSLIVETGECFGLLGPVGAGTTPLVNILSGRAIPTSGHVYIAGYDVEHESYPARNAIETVPWVWDTTRDDTVEEVVRDAVDAGAGPTADITQRLDHVFRTVGVDEQRTTPFNTLSPAMQQRVLIARAMAPNPEILLLNHPTVNVPAQSQYELWDLIARLPDRGFTIFLVTSSRELADHICDRLCFLNNGRTIAPPSSESDHEQAMDMIRLEFTESLDSSPVLERLPAIDSVTVDGNELCITTPNGRELAPHLTTQLETAGYEIETVEISKTGRGDGDPEMAETPVSDSANMT